MSNSIVSSQILSNLKDNDTIYILFDQKDVFDGLRLEKLSYPNNVTYRYQFPDAKVIDFDIRLLDKSIKKTCMNKKELESKKVVKSEDFLKTSYSKIIYEIERKKIKTFIIDNAESKKRKVFIKPVRMLNSVPIEM